MIIIMSILYTLILSNALSIFLKGAYISEVDSKIIAQGGVWAVTDIKSQSLWISVGLVTYIFFIIYK